MFVKGVSGNPAGRKPGSKSKINVREILERVNCNPFEILADLAVNARSEKVRCDSATELASYIAPKLRSLEISGDPDNPVQVTFNLGHKTITATQQIESNHAAKIESATKVDVRK